MFLYQIRSRLSKKTDVNISPEISPEQSISRVDHADWTLFARMEFADTHYNSPKAIDYHALQHQSQGMRQNRTVIAAEQLTAKSIYNAIVSLGQQGGEIMLPEGRVIFDQPLFLPSNISLIGINGRTDFIFRDTDYGIVVQGSNTAPITNVAIKNLRIFHEGEHKFCAALLATHTVGLSFENLDIISPRAVGFLLADNVLETRFNQCHVSDAGLVGFMFIRDVRETVLQNCSAEFCQQSGVFLTDLKLPDHIDPLDFAAQLHHTDQIIGNFAPFSANDPSPFRTDIINCVFKNNRKMGITTDGVGYLSVKNTVIAHNDCEGITLDNGSWGCSIQNCHIYNNGWRGRQVEMELGIDFVREMGLMADGSSKAKLPGVSIDNAVYTRIENNHIECNWGDGIKLVRAGVSSSILNNLIEHNNRGLNDKFHFFGILLGVAQKQHPLQDDFPSCNNKIMGNDILGAHFAGIHLMPGVTGNVVIDNHIRGASFEAIEDHVKSGNLIETAEQPR